MIINTITHALPSSDNGTTSPYPTVDNVTTVKYTISWKVHGWTADEHPLDESVDIRSNLLGASKA